jgi:hypothetical protein
MLAGYQERKSVVDPSINEKRDVQYQAMSSLESAPASDAKVGMIWPGYVQYNYIADGLSDDTGKGHIYQAELVGTAEELLASLMKEFKIEGEIKKDDWSTDAAPSYTVQTKSADGVESWG